MHFSELYKKVTLISLRILNVRDPDPPKTKHNLGKNQVLRPKLSPKTGKKFEVILTQYGPVTVEIPNCLVCGRFEFKNEHLTHSKTYIGRFRVKNEELT